MIDAHHHFTMLPAHAPGQRIGLFGGSFNPPHAGHVAIAHLARTRLRLDRVWVLVTPGNPLKDASALAPLAERMALLRQLLPDPAIVISDIETRAGLRYSRDTVRYVTARAPGVRFVWLMGGDNLVNFHRWQDWKRIADTMPIAVFDRPGTRYAALNAPAARALASSRRPEQAAPVLAGLSAPAWIFMHGRLMPHSSSALRAFCD